MTRRALFTLPLLSFLLLLFTAPAKAGVHGVELAPSPGAAWRCGLSNDDFPGLAAEHMTQPLAAGCELGEAKAYAVVVDLSDSRSVMGAEQMASDSEEQLPPSWKIDSKAYDVITLAGRRASYSRLVGRGDGFTFVSGTRPMVAISANVPLLFEDPAGTPRQVIAVFRVRSPLPSGTAQRKERIAELDRTVRDWAETVRPAGGRTISDRDFELAAYARTRAQNNPAAPPPSGAPAPVADATDRIPAALTAAIGGRATATDFATLEEASRRYPKGTLGDLARSLLDQARQTAAQAEQQQVLVKTLDLANELAGDVFSAFLATAIESGDSPAVHAALRIAKERGWTIRNATPAVAVTASKRRLAFPPSENERAYFELPAAEIVPLLQRNLTRIEDVARRDRDLWRIKRGAPEKSSYLVQYENSVGHLERQPGTGTYRFRPITNVLDLPALEP